MTKLFQTKWFADAAPAARAPVGHALSAAFAASVEGLKTEKPKRVKSALAALKQFVSVAVKRNEKDSVRCVVFIAIEWLTLGCSSDHYSMWTLFLPGCRRWALRRHRLPCARCARSFWQTLLEPGAKTVLL